jgi:hypothetical protein
MTTTRSAPAYAAALTQVLEMLLDLAGLAEEVGEDAGASARITVRVPGEAQVDGAAAQMGVTPSWCHGYYRAVKREGAVTAVVEFAGDSAAPADAATIDAVRCMAAGEIHRDIA